MVRLGIRFGIRLRVKLINMNNNISFEPVRRQISSQVYDQVDSSQFSYVLDNEIWFQVCVKYLVLNQVWGPLNIHVKGQVK